MRVICLDVGEKRIGVAVTDALDLTAQGEETIWTKGYERDAQRVLALCREYETDRVLCGLPRNMDGSEGFQVRKVRDLLETRFALSGEITGSTPAEERQGIIDRFSDAPGSSILLCQIQAGGTGLNMQAASVVIICEPQFKPSIENQAISRAYRMGQGRNVLVYRLLCVDTVDEKIMEMLEEKQAVFDAFADVSVAAQAQEAIAVDSTSFGKIIEEEIERIKQKNQNT